MYVCVTVEIITVLGRALRHCCRLLFLYRLQTACWDFSLVCMCSVLYWCTTLYLRVLFFSALWSEREIKQSSTKLFSVFFPTGRMENKLNQRLWAIRAKKKSLSLSFWLFWNSFLFPLSLTSFLLSFTVFLCCLACFLL